MSIKFKGKNLSKKTKLHSIKSLQSTHRWLRKEINKFCQWNNKNCDQAVSHNQTEYLNNFLFQLMQQELLSSNKWRLKGPFEDFNEAQCLNLMMKWMLVGPKKI